MNRNKNNMNTHTVKRHRNSDTKNWQQRSTTKLPTEPIQLRRAGKIFKRNNQGPDFFPGKNQNMKSSIVHFVLYANEKTASCRERNKMQAIKHLPDRHKINLLLPYGVVERCTQTCICSSSILLKSDNIHVYSKPQD